MDFFREKKRQDTRRPWCQLKTSLKSSFQRRVGEGGRLQALAVLEQASKSRSQAVDILVVGAGWTSTFLIPICEARGLTHAATSRSGRAGTIRFEFNQELGLGSGGGSTGGGGNHEAENGGGNQEEAAASGVEDAHRDDEEGFSRLPQAQTVLITFPITKPGAVARFVRTYMRLHVPEGSSPHFIQLGATSIWDGVAKNLHRWCDRRSPYTRTERAASEDELLALGNSTVLNLAGLWGGKRDTRNWSWRWAPFISPTRLLAAAYAYLLTGDPQISFPSTKMTTRTPRSSSLAIKHGSGQPPEGSIDR